MNRIIIQSDGRWPRRHRLVRQFTLGGRRILYEELGRYFTLNGVAKAAREARRKAGSVA